MSWQPRQRLHKYLSEKIQLHKLSLKFSANSYEYGREKFMFPTEVIVTNGWIYAEDVNSYGNSWGGLKRAVLEHLIFFNFIFLYEQKVIMSCKDFVQNVLDLDFLNFMYFSPRLPHRKRSVWFCWCLTVKYYHWALVLLMFNVIIISSGMKTSTTRVDKSSMSL